MEIHPHPGAWWKQAQRQVEDPQPWLSSGLLQQSSWSAGKGLDATALFMISWWVLKQVRHTLTLFLLPSCQECAESAGDHFCKQLT